MWRAAVSFRASGGWSVVLIFCGWLMARTGRCHWYGAPQRLLQPNWGLWGAQSPQSLHSPWHCVRPHAGAVSQSYFGHKWGWCPSLPGKAPSPSRGDRPRVAVSSLLCLSHPPLVSEWVTPMCNLQWRAAMELLWSSNSTFPPSAWRFEDRKGFGCTGAKEKGTWSTLPCKDTCCKCDF